MRESKKISLEFIWDKNIFVEAGMLAYTFKMNYSYKKYIGWAIVVAFGYGLFLATKTNSYQVLYLTFILMAYWFYTKKIMQKFRLKKQFLKEKNSGMKMKFEINNKYIKINDYPIPWNHISLVVFSPKGFLLERNEGYPFLPISAFKSNDDIIKFKEIVENQTAMIRNVN